MSIDVSFVYILEHQNIKVEVATYFLFVQ